MHWVSCLVLLACLSPNAPREVRVLIVEAAEAATIECTGPIEVVRDGAVVEEMEGPSKNRVSVVGGRIMIGGTRHPGAEVAVRAKGAELLRVGKYSYHGRMRVVKNGGKIDVVNDVDLEEYVTGVVPYEIGARSPLEALKVQAVCARTFVWRRLDRTGKRHFDVHCDVRDQVYRGHLAYKSEVPRAVRYTEGMILTWRGEPITTYYHSTCGGKTESEAEWLDKKESIPPLAGAECGFCEKGKYKNWTVEFSEEEIRKAFGVSSEIQSIRTAGESKSGRAKEIRMVYGLGRTKTVQATSFRLKLSPMTFRSTWITSIEKKGEKFVFRGHGWGHGVGMCQVGVIEMAQQGKSYLEILERYYPGTSVERGK